MATKTESKRTSIILFIGGMTCASCVSHVEGALKSVPGVKNVVVNLATGKASVDYDAALATPKALKKAVEEVGYTATLNTATLQVTGMTCASCVSHIQEAVGALPGVANVVVNLATSSARVEYSPDVTP